MKLIDADELELDTEWNDYDDGFVSYSQRQIDDAEEVKAVPLDRIKEAKDAVENINPIYSTIGNRIPVLKNCDDIKTEVLAILDKLIAEVEG